MKSAGRKAILVPKCNLGTRSNMYFVSWRFRVHNNDLRCIIEAPITCQPPEAALDRCGTILTPIGSINTLSLMRRFVSSFAWRLAFLLLAPGFASGASARAERGVATLPSGQTSTTFSFVDRCGLILIRTRINGQGPFLFLLDCGADGICLDQSLARKLALKPVGKRRTSYGIGPKSPDIQWTEPVTLQIGDASLTKQRLAATDLSAAGDPLGRDLCGYLGRDFFEHFIVRIDPAHKKATLSLPTVNAPGNNGMVLPLRFNKKGEPLVEAKIDGLKGTFECDTGFNLPLMLNRNFVERHHLQTKFRSQFHDAMISGAGGKTGIQIVPSMSLELGGVVIPCPVVFQRGNVGPASGRAIDGIIGKPILASFPVTFDYPHKRLVLELPLAAASAPQ